MNCTLHSLLVGHLRKLYNLSAIHPADAGPFCIQIRCLKICQLRPESVKDNNGPRVGKESRGFAESRYVSVILFESSKVLEILEDSSR
jgi:hypothetical protein